MKGWMATLGITCVWASPGLVLVGIVLALFDLTVAAQRWAAQQPSSPDTVGIATATVQAAGCSLALATELRDMIGRD